MELKQAPEPFATVLATVLHANVMSMGWRQELARWERKPENEELIRRQWADAALHGTIALKMFVALSGQNVGTEEGMRQWLSRIYEEYYLRPPEPRDCTPPE